MEPKEKLVWSLVLLPIAYGFLVDVQRKLDKILPITTMSVYKLLYMAMFMVLSYFIAYLCNSIVVNAVKLARVKELNTKKYTVIDGLTSKMLVL